MSKSQQVSVLVACLQDEKLKSADLGEYMKSERKVISSMKEIFEIISPLRNDDMLPSKDVLISSLCGTLGSDNELKFHEFNKLFGTNFRKNRFLENQLIRMDVLNGESSRFKKSERYIGRSWYSPYAISLCHKAFNDSAGTHSDDVKGTKWIRKDQTVKV